MVETEEKVWRKIETEGEFEITVSEDRLEKNENITLEYTAEIWCGFSDEAEYKKIEKEQFSRRTASERCLYCNRKSLRKEKRKNI